jgi:hypothetical protein
VTFSQRQSKNQTGELSARSGIRADGTKVPLGLWEGASENAAVCRRALADLDERGLSAERGLLVVIDGSKALRTVVGKALGAEAAVQRCRRHKEQNVLGHLPEGERPWVKRKLREAWAQERAELAERRLLELARALESSMRRTLQHECSEPRASVSILRGRYGCTDSSSSSSTSRSGFFARRPRWGQRFVEGTLRRSWLPPFFRSEGAELKGASPRSSLAIRL